MLLLPRDRLIWSSLLGFDRAPGSERQEQLTPARARLRQAEARDCIVSTDFSKKPWHWRQELSAPQNRARLLALKLLMSRLINIWG